MDTITRHSVPQTKPHSKQQFNNAEDIYSARCPHCGGYYTIGWAHLGGHAQSTPHVVCDNPQCPGLYLVASISDDLHEEYVQYVLDREEANEAWVQQLTNELLEGVRE